MTHSYTRRLVISCLIIIFAGSSALWAAPQDSQGTPSTPVRLALFPFVKGENVNDFEYEQISSSFHLALSRRPEFEVVSRFELMRMIQEAEEAGEKFDGEERIYSLARKNKIDLIVFGSVGAVHEFAYRGVELRTVGLKVEIASVARKQIFNTVAWSTSYLSGGEIQQGEKLSALSTMAAGKLLWQSPDFFPVHVAFDPESRKTITRNPDAAEDYKNRVRNLLAELKLPRGVELDSVAVNIREKKDVSGTGMVGCFTLVGWLFLPFWNVDYNVDVLVRVKFLNETGVAYSEFADARQSSESFHLSASVAELEKPTLELVDQVSKQLRTAIERDRNLFRDRGSLLNELFQSKRAADSTTDAENI